MGNRYRSFFWPGVLILVGVFALLINAGLVPTDRLYRLVDLWPVILIVIGLELLIRRAMQGTAADIAAVLIVVLAAGGAVAYVAVGPAISTGTLQASAPLEGLDHMTVRVDVGAANITLRGDSSLGSNLYQARIEYSGPKPSVKLDRSSRDLSISQSGTFGVFQNRRFTLDLQINPKVLWRIFVNSGAATDTFNLAGVNVESMELNTGASRDDITLGEPTGTVPISLNGGALTVKIHRAQRTAISVEVSGGAVNLEADGKRQRGIGHQSWHSDGFDQAANRFSIDINGGACTVTIDTAVSSG
jgi:hypothetical protein